MKKYLTYLIVFLSGIYIAYLGMKYYEKGPDKIRREAGVEKKPWIQIKGFDDDTDFDSDQFQPPNPRQLDDKTIKKIMERRQVQREKMRKIFRNQMKDLNSTFDNKKSFSFSFSHDFGDKKIEEKEDDQFYYVIINGEVDKEGLDIKVERGMLHIEGVIKEQTESNSKNSKSYQEYHSSFSQSLSLPSGIDEHNFKIESGDNQLIIKFPKKL